MKLQKKSYLNTVKKNNKFKYVIFLQIRQSADTKRYEFYIIINSYFKNYQKLNTKQKSLTIYVQ